MKSRMLFQIAFAAALWLPGFVHATEAVKVGVLNVGSINAWVSESEGFWKKEQLDASIHRFSSGATVNQALLAGGIDFGYIGFGPAIFAASRNLPFIYPVNGAYTDRGSATNAIIVRKDAPYKSIKDLDGKTVAVQTKGTIEHIIAVVLAEKNGAQIQLREIPFEQQDIALSRGDVDAVSTHTPNSEYMIYLRGHRALEWVPGAAVPNFQIVNLAVRRAYAQEHPETVFKMVRAYIQTNRWIMQHQSEAKQIIGLKYLNYQPALVDKMVTLKWQRNGDPLLPSLAYFGAQMKRLGLINEVPPLENYFVKDFLQKALVELGTIADPDFTEANAAVFPQP